MKRVSRESLLIGIILLTALSVRIWGANYDLPYIYHPDEPRYITISQNIFKTGDLNPHFFNYPSLFFYINALAYIPYYLLGKLIGVFHTPNDILAPISLAMGVTQAQMPTTVLLGRVITICFGVGTVGLTYLVGKQITGKAVVGVLASLMVAIEPTNVWNSRLITPDTFVTFFSLASFLASILVYQQGKTWQYVAAGICVGLTVSSKYNGGLIVLPLFLAHFLHYGKAALKQPKLYLALLLCGVGFLATTPYAILDSARFLNDLKFESQHYSTGHAGMEGNSLEWYLNYMWNTGGGLYLFAVLGILYGSIFHPKETSLLSLFPLAYFAFISSFVVRNNRTFLPLTPLLFVSAAWFLMNLFDRLRALRIEPLRRSFLAILAILAIITLALPASQTIASTQHLMTGNSRETARVWIDDNLPPGAKIAIESYSPFVNPARFSVQGFGRMIDHDAEWYIEQGFDYLVFSQGMYRRFYIEPERYRNEVSQYDKLFERFHLVRLFTDGGYEVRVYKVK
ncbi:MAG: phospholipid carrier-dependent glycosyltransferase [Chloroflexi bacterium]|nr:MAG: phospholipid carrier-dependent glycosyltransferase [Chloroflexota bacterium]